MDKKIIRLTESDLHNIVKESVNKILSEMDWKTYMNAGKKRLSQRGANNGKYANGFDSLRKASDEFDKKYGYNVRKDPNFDHREWFDNPEKQGITRTYGDPAGQYGGGDPENIRMQVKTDVGIPGASGRNWGRRRTLSYDPKYKYADMDQLWTNDHSISNIEDRFFYGKNGTVDREKEPILASLIKHNHDRAKKEVDDYEDGNYEYIKGKGWQLKK